MIEMSPDYNPVFKEFSQKSRNTQIINPSPYGDYNQNNNQIGTFI